MKIPMSAFLNFISLTFFFLLLCGVQATLWYQLFGSVPPPLLWTLVLVYILITRGGFQALLFCYFLTFLASRFSSAPLGILLPVVSLLCGGVLLFRSRIFWRSSSYFVLVSMGASVFFHIFYLVTSFIIENNNAGVLFTDRFVQVILTVGFCYPIYLTLRWIDRLFQHQETFGSGSLT